MNHTQKDTIIKMRQSNMTFSAIAKATGLSLNTVKSICYRCGTKKETSKGSAVLCKECGRTITTFSKNRPRLFCCDACKVAWWNKHRAERRTNKISISTCAVCGNVFASYTSANRKYCSQACFRERGEHNG